MEVLTKKSQVKDNVCLIPLIELSWSQLVVMERLRRPPTGRTFPSTAAPERIAMGAPCDGRFENGSHII